MPGPGGVRKEHPKLCKTCACMRKDPVSGDPYCAYLPMTLVTVYQEGKPYHASLQPGITNPDKQGCEVGWRKKTGK